MTEERPRTDERDPAGVIQAMVEGVLALAETWTEWDGRPRAVDDRVAQLARVESPPDRWHGSYMTTAADLAPFTKEDLEEARSRLDRLSLLWVLRLASVSDEDMDRSSAHSWSLREIAFHLAESSYYADALGDLSAPTDPVGR
jgi:hypothetical protein